MATFQRAAKILAGKRYLSESQILFARMTTPPDDARKVLIDNCIKSLKSNGVWSKLDALWVPAAHAAQAAQLNWLSTSFTLQPVNTPTFTADRGYAGDGSSSYLDTNYNPSAGPGFSQNNASLGVWINGGTDTAISTSIVIGAFQSGGSYITPRAAGDVVRGRMTSGTLVTTDLASNTTHGFYAFSRQNSANFVAYKNTSASSAQSATSSSIPNLNFFLGALNNAGSPASFTDARLAFAFAGTGLSAADKTNLRTAASTYLTAIGANL